MRVRHRGQRVTRGFWTRCQYPRFRPCRAAVVVAAVAAVATAGVVAAGAAAALLQAPPGQLGAHGQCCAICRPSLRTVLCTSLGLLEPLSLLLLLLLLQLPLLLPLLLLLLLPLLLLLLLCLLGSWVVRRPHHQHGGFLSRGGRLVRRL